MNRSILLSASGSWLAAAASMLILSGSPGFSAETTNSAPDVTKLSRTVGLDIINRTVNPDKTVSLTFKWSEKGNPLTRTVVLNDDTIVVYNGKLKKFTDLTDPDFHAKAVATVGADGVTTVLLRFGKSPLPKDQLTPAQTTLLATLAPPATAASEAALDKRVTALVASLALTDPVRQERVRLVIATNLRAVRDAHNAGLQLDPSVHKNLVAGLQADLSPDQVESVKDKLTLNKLPLTFKVYHQILTGLKPEDDRVIMDQLQRAREECLDVKNADEMAPIFKRHKTEIEKYLNSHGYDWDKSYKAFVEGQKSESTKVTGDSVPAPK
jgi:hypothetical protein